MISKKGVIQLHRNWWVVMICFTMVFMSGCAAGKYVEKTGESTLIKRTSEVTVLRSEFVSGEDDILIYICISDYEKTMDGLNLDVLSAAIDFDKILTQSEFEVGGYSCGIFHTNSVSYACWTSAPEVSGILKYDPTRISEDEVMKIIESVFTAPQ